MTFSQALKFHVQHDWTSGVENSKIQPGQESKMAANTKRKKKQNKTKQKKNNKKKQKNNKINLFSRTTCYTRLQFCMEHKWDLCDKNYKNERNL